MTSAGLNNKSISNLVNGLNTIDDTKFIEVAGCLGGLRMKEVRNEVIQQSQGDSKSSRIYKVFEVEPMKEKEEDTMVRSVFCFFGARRCWKAARIVVIWLGENPDLSWVWPFLGVVHNLSKDARLSEAAATIIGSNRVSTARIVYAASLYVNDANMKVNAANGSTFVTEALRKSDQMHQTFDKSYLAMTYELDDMIELPKSQPKKTYKEDLECEMDLVKIPKCMEWLYDEPIGDLDMMEHKVDNPSPQSTLQVLPSFEEYTPPVTYPEEVEETIGIPTKVKPLDHMKLEDLGLNTCSHDLFPSSREFPSVDESEPQPLPNLPFLDVNLGGKRGTNPPINPYSLGSFRMKVIFDEKKLGSRKAYLLEDKKIPSVGVFDEVIWMAFRGNTRNLGLNWRRNGQDYDSTPRSLKELYIVPRDGIAIPRDAVISYKRQRQDLHDGVRM
ncbi:hypothetical protein Tco_0151520 [Tanacetum coccineum]